MRIRTALFAATLATAALLGAAGSAAADDEGMGLSGPGSSYGGGTSDSRMGRDGQTPGGMTGSDGSRREASDESPADGLVGRLFGM
ncbi:hypothetical protein AB0C96_10950 [Streptomyces sp. NPDC048506]|uniref:hypothetical protein n=1 Tax=Streptomyces sp. NPDC048506 TaxID=3155028 RepID=UPI0034355CFA